MNLLLRNVNVLLADISYEILVIEDGQVPLSGKISGNFDTWFMVTVGIIAVIAVASILLIYYQLCRKYHARMDKILEQYGLKGYRGFNIYKLRRELERMENEILDSQEKVDIL